MHTVVDTKLKRQVGSDGSVNSLPPSKPECMSLPKSTQQYKSGVCLVALALAGCGGAGGPNMTALEPTNSPLVVGATLSVPAGYPLVWSDEFDIAGLPNPAKWEYDTSRNKAGWYNEEKQYYSRARIENAEVRDGNLVITARNEKLFSEPDWGGQSYTSARLITKGRADWTYGFYEIRAKVPCGKGTWSAIWMLGSQGEWPAGGELDIMEHVGKEPSRILSTVHTGAASGGDGPGASTQVPDACAAFHTYQMLWTPQQASFGVDGKIHFTYTNPGSGTAKWPFDASQFMILNVAIGGFLGGVIDDSIFPVRMEVDYVRVYQKAK
jgi:beta-glucanase (GH16 family)